MLFHTLFLDAMVYAQSLEVSDLTSLTSIKEITINGLLALALYIIWKENTSLKEEIKVIRKEKEEDKDKERDKYFDAVVRLNQSLDENNKTNLRVEKALEKILDK